MTSGGRLGRGPVFFFHIQHVKFHIEELRFWAVCENLHTESEISTSSTQTAPFRLSIFRQEIHPKIVFLKGICIVEVVIWQKTEGILNSV